MKRQLAGAVLIMAAGLAIALFAKSRISQGSRLEERAEAVRELTRTASHIDEHMLEIRHGIVNHYDKLTWDFRGVHAQLAALEQMEVVGSKKEKELLRKVAREFEEKEERIEEFKTRNAIFKNSLNYFPLAISRPRGSSSDLGFLFHAALDSLERDVLLYNVNSTPELADDIETDLRALDQLVPRASKQAGDLGLVVIHARRATRLRGQVDQLVSEIVNNAVEDTLESLARAYDEDARQRRAVGSRYRLALFGLAVLLLGWLLVSFRRLRAKTQELQASLKRLEETQKQLLHADRMATTGQLIAGIAHEINNPLTFISTNVAFVHEQLSQLTSTTAETQGPVLASPAMELIRECQSALDDARAGSERVCSIVKGLKAVSRVGDDTRSPVDLLQVLEVSIAMAWHEIRHKAELVRDLGPVPFVYANEARLGQVFLNLLVNAAQAMDENKRDINQIRVVTRQMDDGRALVEIHDNGCGMSAEVQARIFEPFFTTKPVGVGTGLGLPICRGIIDSLNGEMTVESELGKGTAFRVMLPIHDSEQPERNVKPQTVAAPRRGRVLVIDDEPMIGEAIRRQLSKDHGISTTTDARQALEWLRAGESYDLIVCDLMMPFMTGMDFYQEVTKSLSHHASSVVFLTGGALTESSKRFLETVKKIVLEKPLDWAKLDALLQERLRHPAPPSNSAPPLHGFHPSSNPSPA